MADDFGGLFSIDTSNGEISTTKTIEDADLGDYILTVNVTDNEGGTDQAIVNVSLTNVNDQPVVDNAEGNKAYLDGDAITAFDVSDNFSDADGDALTYSISGLPVGLSMSAAGIISGTIDTSASQGGVAGVYTVVVTASDGSVSTDDTFTISVGNPAPDFINETSGNDDDTYNFNNVAENTAAGVIGTAGATD